LLIADWFSALRRSIGNWQSQIGNVLRDGVTGNTSGFELEDEGLTPSPAANPFKRSKVLRFIYIGSILFGGERK
jgi:hypothetical protein